MKRIPAKYLTKRVAVTWIDPTGYINSDLKDVDVSECVSEGTLMSVNNRRLILRTAVYKDSDFGDYSAISMGCVEKVTLL
tara:strand:+ start:121 stop:360 length:240 start_codon:yes stop_codon:yes gene_type:complete